MRGLTRRLNRSLASLFREKRLFLQTEGGTTYLRLTPMTQLGLVAGACATAGWLAFATAHVALDRLGEESARGGVALLGEAAEARIAALAEERDLRASEARSAQNRFRLAMDRIGHQQSEILRAVEEKRELDLALGVLRARLSDAARQRDLARVEADELRGQMAEVSEAFAASGANDLAATLETVAATLQEAVRVRDEALGEREVLSAQLADLETRLSSMTLRHEEMIAELEYAVRTSFEPLEGLFKAADLDLDHVLATVRRDHAGTGGGAEGEAALRPAVRMSTRSYAPDAAGSQADDRFDELLLDLDRMNILRIAAGRIPYAAPVTAEHRFTSGYGYRRDPKNGRRRMHSGIDLAAPKGTPIYATADGVVTSAGGESGYGQTVRIRHEFGFETLYAHKSNIRVQVGQRVSRGDHIGDMGATGRATGVHLHYEVRLNGQPMNPMVYLEAARNVF